MKWTNCLGMLVVGVLASGAAAQLSVPYQGGPTTGTATLVGPVIVMPQRLEKGTFLGITTSPVPQLLRQHLRLPRGMGLVVDFVEKDSPADAAGLKQYDVLQKLNDQFLINPQQLAVLVRSFKAGDEVKLTVIREAKAQEITAKLTEKDVPVLEDITGNISNTIFLNPPQGMGLPPGTPDIRQWMNQHFQPGGGMILQGQGKSVMSWSDGIHDGHQTLTVTTENGKDKHLTVTDDTGKAIFDGPIQTEEQRKVLPADIAEKLKKMEQTMAVEVGGGVDLRLMQLKAQLSQAQAERARLAAEGRNAEHPQVKVLDARIKDLQQRIDALSVEPARPGPATLNSKGD